VTSPFRRWTLEEEAELPLDELISGIAVEVPDYPLPGVLFRDLTPVFAHGRAFRRMVEGLARPAVSDPRVGAIVVTGAGRGFCPGADMAGLQALSSEGGEDGRARRPARSTIYPMSIPKLMVAAIGTTGVAVGITVAVGVAVGESSTRPPW